MPRCQRRLILGCGYLGLRVAHQWRDAGHEVFALTRSRDRAAALREQGIQPLVGDVTERATLVDLPEADSLLYAVGYDRAAAPDIRAVYAGGLRSVLAAIPPSITRAIYVSTTGAYGAAGGNWVDETTPPDPQRDGGRASLAAEQILAAHPLAAPSAILRLAGLYGPGRVPHLAALRGGEPIAAPSAGWLNLIHVDDAARIVVAVDRWLTEQPPVASPHLFCVSDGRPVVRSAYYAAAARLLGAPAPQFITPPPDSPAAARAAASRRVSNRKLLATLPVQLAYPDYRVGLASALGAES